MRVASARQQKQLERGGGGWLAKLSQSMTFQFEMCLMGFHGLRRSVARTEQSQCGIYQV